MYPFQASYCQFQFITTFLTTLTVTLLPRSVHIKIKVKRKDGFPWMHKDSFI